MTSANATSVTDYLATLDPMRTSALIIGVLVAFGALYLLLHYATRTGRARAREAARTWADVKRVEWSARAEARAARARRRDTDEARKARAARTVLLAGGAAVVLIAIAAMNLSAHGIQARLDEVDLGDVNERVSVFLVFEGLLALAGGLSFWHQVTGRAGVDRYAVGMWGISFVMAYLAAWGGEHWLFGIFPIIAAVAGHELVAAEAKRRGKYRGILGRGATSEDATAVDTERRKSAIVTYGTRANVGLRGTRWLWAILHARAERAADARGILTDEVRAELRVRAASRYVGARALAPEAVEDANPWARPTAPRARAEDVVADAPAPAIETRAPEAAPAAPVVEDIVAPAPAEAPHVPAPRLQLVADPIGDVDMLALIADPDMCGGGAEVRVWVGEFWEAHEDLPTGRQLADKFGGNPGACRKWVTKLKQARAAAA
jgi:hypothetical protein